MQTHRAQLLSILQEDADIMVTASAPTNLEIMDKNGHKGNGIQQMALILISLLKIQLLLVIILMMYRC